MTYDSTGLTSAAVTFLVSLQIVTLCVLLSDTDVFVGPTATVILDDLTLGADADVDGDNDVVAIVLLVVTAGEEDADTRSGFDTAKEQCSVVSDPLAAPVTVPIIVLRLSSGRTDSTVVVVTKQLPP